MDRWVEREIERREVIEKILNARCTGEHKGKGVIETREKERARKRERERERGGEEDSVVP